MRRGANALPSHTGAIFERTTPRIATSGALTMGVNAVPPMPPSEEMVKVAHKYAEDARVAVRHVRRDGFDVLKKLLKEHAMPEDEGKKHENEVQKATDDAIKEIDTLLAGKEKEIMQV